MYTLEMQRAFHSITPPPNFGVQVFEHNVEGMFFLEIVADEEKFVRLLDEEKRGAVEYMIRVKDALEHNGAIVQITRKAIE
jgi:hypothetical protein